MMRKGAISFIILFFCSLAYGQVPTTDSTAVQVLAPTQRQSTIKQKDGTDLQILAGTVKLKQGNTIFYCDSCVVNTKTRVFEAFGRVHINDSDTAHVYANYLRYLIDPRYAYLKGNVRLTDGHGTLTTNELEYDVAQKVGTYKNGGKVTNKKTVITSREGVYYADLNDVYFKQKVEIKDPSHYVTSDSILYNTETGIARFISQTFLRDSTGRTIETREGFYDPAGGRSEFTQRTRIQDGSLIIEGDQIVNDEASGIVQIRENGVLIDTAQGINILANEIFANKKTGAYLATRNPLMIIRQEKDSIYIKGDTLFSARLTDRFQQTETPPDSTAQMADEENNMVDSVDRPAKTPLTIDSTAAENNMVAKVARPSKTPLTNDSTNRYFEAFHNVKIFTDSLQAVSDSLFYSFRDSTFQLYQEPIVWSNNSQVTGDTIYLYTKNKKADRIKVFENGFLINTKQEGIFNQVKATRIDGFFTQGSMDSVLAKGAAESIYFIQDDDSAYSGINQTASDRIDVYFLASELKKIVFRGAVKGTVWPITQKKPSEMRLEGFQWLDRLRPKTKYDLFQ